MKGYNNGEILLTILLTFSSAKSLGIRLVLYLRNELRDTREEWIAVSAAGVTNSRGKLFRSFPPRNRNMVARIERDRHSEREIKGGRRERERERRGREK